MTPIQARIMAALQGVPTAVGTPATSPGAARRYQSARRPMLPSMIRRFSLRSPPSSRV